MGCFNIHGFYSHLPIKYGDRVGAILCAKLDIRENLGMDTISNGLFPLMAPIYGIYNDYNGIEDVEETPTTRAFKSLTNVDFTEFIESSQRNGSVSMNTKDNGNQFDDIPGYHQIIKYFIPKHNTLLSNLYTNEKIEEAKNNNDKELLKQYKELKKFDQKEIKELYDATFLVIYEHEEVLKQLANIGSSYMNTKWFSETYNADKEYNDISKYTDLCGGTIFNISKTEQEVFDKMMDDIEKIKQDKIKDEEKVKKIYTKYRESHDLYTLAVKADSHLFQNWMKYKDYFCAIYKNQFVNYIELKNDILNLLYIDSGLRYMGGVYTLSLYAGQDIYFDEINKMQKAYNKIIKKFKEKDEEENTDMA